VAASAPAIPTNAFRGDYFDNMDLTNFKLSRTDSLINFNWGAGSPDPAIGADTFSVRWEGNWNFATSGVYEYKVTADDGIRLYLDGTLLINQWRDQAPTTYTAQAAVTAGLHTVKVEYYENAWGAVAQASWQLMPAGDTTPPTGTVTINSGAATTNVTAVTLTLSATDNSGSVSQMQFSNDGTSYSAAEAYGTTKAWTLASGDGTKTVYAKFKDAAGNWSAATTDTIVLDTTAPTISAVGASAIGSTTATITWTTNEGGTSQVDYGLTTAYGQLTAFNATLSTAHTVSLNGFSSAMLYHYRVRSKDAAGNEAVSADATFTTAAPADTTPPSGSITINSGAAATNTAAVTLTLSASDNAGSVSQMQFSNDGSTYSTAEAYATTKSWTLTSGDGTKTVYAKFKDTAGNWSAAATDTIVLDTTPPQLSITSPADGAVITAP